MCGVKDLSVELSKRRLRWFRHVSRAAGGVLSEVEEVRVGGKEKVEGVCDRRYESVVNKQTYGTRSPS
ncbi:hypothetical protein E2C01_064516 [Portunus trituberculatus]|uniref:Uncharacterized protein n=1 Tax=Portunus trituberculatus TaxID=210409 RepID=A0A5B7HNZ6_PORTR|nr:hypothetical protein [Portunus trituberculatus]